jgi:alkylhydroperoxidase/carboxymuconolactone decarboxylase family protein YurZ
MAKSFFVEALEQHDPEFLSQMTAIRNFAEKDGALSAKTKILMEILGDAILGHADGVKSLADRARAQGATEAEIAETVRMAFLFGGLPGLVTGTNAWRK